MAYNRTICDNLTEYPEEQVEVQKYASSLQIVNKVLQVWDTHYQNDLANVISMNIFVSKCSNIISTKYQFFNVEYNYHAIFEIVSGQIE